MEHLLPLFIYQIIGYLVFGIGMIVFKIKEPQRFSQITPLVFLTAFLICTVGWPALLVFLILLKKKVNK